VRTREWNSLAESEKRPFGCAQGELSGAGNEAQSRPACTHGRPVLCFIRQRQLGKPADIRKIDHRSPGFDTLVLADRVSRVTSTRVQSTNLTLQ
jgi:hypothetical protein